MIRPLMVVILCFFTLTGCKEKVTYSYLISHPKFLEKEINRCRNDGETEDCKIVLSAATDLNDIINEQQMDPEKFGQKILDAEYECVLAKEALVKETQIFNDLKEKNSNPADVQKAQVALRSLQAAYDEQHEKVKIYLGVVGLGSPQ